MKKVIVVVLIVLVGGALLIGPLLNNTGDVAGGNPGGQVDPLTKSLPASFNFNGNPGTIYRSESNIDITVKDKYITTLEVKLDGKVMQSWENPTSNVKFTFTPNMIGTYSLELISTKKDGSQSTDTRSIRILSDIEPRMLEANILATYDHDIESFTQGLEFSGNDLWEGTGLNGKSEIREVEITNGEVKRQLKLDGTYFGEGITIMGDQLFQLTWQNGRCFTYDISGDITLTGDHNYVGEGWGLCNDGNQLIMSNGTEVIVFRDPETFEETRRIQVYNDREAIVYLNELEYIDGKIYANVYQTNIVIAIDPETGRVLEQITCDQLIKEGQGSGDVLNGIAQDASGKIYMTGKNWPKLFEVSFSEQLP